MRLDRFKQSGPAQGYTVRIDHGSTPEIQAAFDNAISEDKIKKSQFRDYVDSSPNLNAKFAEEIELAEEWFAGQNVTVAPVSILTPDRFKAALDIISRFTDQSGSFQAGRTVIKVPSDFSADYILSLLLHEGAHSEAQEQEPFVVSRKKSDAEDEPSNWKHTLVELNGFSTYRVDDAGNIVTGDFLEEAYADLTRVYGQRDLGRVAKFYGHDYDYRDVGVRYVRHERAHMAEKFEEEGLVALPGEFMFYHSETTKGRSKSALAAYTLELMDVAAPDLYNTMRRSRQPVRLDNIEERIDSIRPGLYTDLSRIGGDDHAYRRGLQVAKTAITR